MKFIIYFLSVVPFYFLIQIGFAQNDQFLNPIDIFNLEYVNNPRISSQGKQIIYERNYFDIQTEQ